MIGSTAAMEQASRWPGEMAAVVVLFGAALATAWLMRAARLPAILGFLLAGILIGPSVLNLISHERVHFFAELGLVLLLFTVGLDLSLGPLVRTGWRLLAGALLQIGLTSAAVGLAMRYLLSSAWDTGLVGGVAVALSSTAIVLKHLSDRGEIDSPAGGLMTGILLVQDLVVLLVLVMLPMFARTAMVPWATVLVRAGLAVSGLAVVILLARRIMPVLVQQVFRFGGQELTTLFAVVMACAGAWLAGLAGWSWALGSFIAGVLLAQTDWRHQLRAEITPFRGALDALFFISIGMLVRLELLAAYAGPLALAILGALTLKALLAGVAVGVAGWPLRLAIAAGLGLCTISEFGYVLIKEAVKLELLPVGFFDRFVACTVGTMVLGALLVPVAEPAAARLSAALLREPVSAGGPRSTPAGSPAGHVIIVGYGLNGQNLARVLRAIRIAYTVIEMQPTTAHRARSDAVDVPVIVGDATRRSILEKAGLGTARALVVSIADHRATRSIVAQAHRARPDLYILARTRYVAELETLFRLGARQVIPEEFETSIEIFAHLLKEFGIPDNVIDQQVTMVRAGHYGMLRGRPADRLLRAEWLALLEAAVTQTFLLHEASPAVGRTIRELDLRARTGVTIVAVTRAGKPSAPPPADLKLAAGDVLVLVGTHRQLDEARLMLDRLSG